MESKSFAGKQGLYTVTDNSPDLQAGPHPTTQTPTKQQEHGVPPYPAPQPMAGPYNNATAPDPSIVTGYHQQPQFNPTVYPQPFSQGPYPAPYPMAGSYPLQQPEPPPAYPGSPGFQPLPQNMAYPVPMNVIQAPQQPLQQTPQQPPQEPPKVIHNPPKAVTPAPRTHVSKTGHGVKTVAIILSFGSFFCGCWWILLFSVPAICLAARAITIAAEGREKVARRYEVGSVACIVLSVLMTGAIAFMIYILVITGGGNSSRG